MVEDNSYSKVAKRVLISMFKSHPVKTEGVLIYGDIENSKYSRIFTKIFNLSFSIFAIITLINGFNDKNVFSLILATFAIFVLIRNWFNNKIEAQRIVDADEMLSLWLIKNFPTETVSSHKLLMEGSATSESGKYFFLEINKTTSTIYVFDVTTATSTELSDFLPTEIRVVEYKTN